MSNATLRVLFVDDEQSVLVAIERQLRRDRMRWEMVFALGGQRGLEEIRNGALRSSSRGPSPRYLQDAAIRDRCER